MGADMLSNFKLLLHTFHQRLKESNKRNCRQKLRLMEQRMHDNNKAFIELSVYNSSL